MSKKVDIKAISDEDLVEMIISLGEMDLFGELYDRYGNKVYRKVISMIGNVEESKDLTHDILIKSFLSLAKFEQKSKFSTWLYTVTYNNCIDYIRKRKRRDKQKEELTRNWDVLADVKDAEIQDIEMQRLEELLEEIPLEDKTILLMYYQDDMSIKDLEVALELGSSAIKMRLSRARKKLKALYEEKYKE